MAVTFAELDRLMATNSSVVALADLAYDRHSLAGDISQGVAMNLRAVVALLVLVPFLFLTAEAAPGPANAAGEYSKHFAALSKLSVAVAQAMPPEEYAFRPHAESMSFGQLLTHMA